MRFALWLAAAALSGCASAAKLPVSAGTGPNPTLPPPSTSLIPMVKVASARGWVYSYYGPNVDKRVKPPRPDLVASAIKPDYALGPHTASLGLAWSDGSSLPAPFGRGMFVGQHGSWNRYPRSGTGWSSCPSRGACRRGSRSTC